MGIRIRAASPNTPFSTQAALEQEEKAIGELEANVSMAAKSADARTRSVYVANEGIEQVELTDPPGGREA